MSEKTPTEHELVALLFAKQALHLSQWTTYFAAVTEHIGAAFGLPSDRGPPKYEFLDRATLAQTGRVLELRLLVERLPSLQECKTVTDGDAFQRVLAPGHIEIVLQPGSLYAAHRAPGLAVFDMDSTLIQQEVIDELARAVGLYDQVSAITEAAMRGEAPYTDFEASLRARVALLNGVPLSIWEQLKQGTITFTPGALDLARALKSLGWKTAVLSGGFTNLAGWVQSTLGLDYMHANHLVADADRQILKGELVPEAPIIHGERKRELLTQLASENNIPTENIIAVGDGSNDLPMMGAAGLGIAFNAKPKVQLAAPAKLNSPTLLDVLHILGYSQDEIDLAVAGKQVD